MLSRRCDCAQKSQLSRVFTCPICVGLALGPYGPFGADDQIDLFEEDKSASVSAYIRLLDQEYLERSTQIGPSPDGLPF